MFRKLLKSEGGQFLLVAAIAVGVVYGTLTAVQAHYVGSARTHAQALAGEHEIVNAKYYWIGYVELQTSENETIQVPITNDYGMRVATWFWGDASRRDLPYRIRASYSEQPVPNKRGDPTKSSDETMAGTYLAITEVDSAITAQK